MAAYISLVRVRFAAMLQYRAAAAAGVATQLFWGVIRTMIFEAFYSLNTKSQPLSRDQMISYVWLGQAMLALLPLNVDGEIKESIRNGAVLYDLLRPLDLYNHWYCRAIAIRTAPTLLRCIPIFVVACLFFGLRAPVSLAAGAAWLLITLLALLLNCAVMCLVVISLLWTISSDGINRLIPTVVYTLSGMMIPLQFYPDFMQPLLRVLPFRNMIDVPFRVYIGSIPAANIWGYALQSAAWTVLLIMLGRALLARGVHKLVVQGG